MDWDRPLACRRLERTVTFIGEAHGDNSVCGDDIDAAELTQLCRARAMIDRQFHHNAVVVLQRGATSVLQMMAAEVPVVPQTEDLSEVVELLQKSSARFVGVVDAAGRLVGYLTPENLSELLVLRSSREKL